MKNCKDKNMLDKSAIEDNTEISDSEALAKRTQKMLTEWRARTRKKRFRFQNVEGTF